MAMIANIKCIRCDHIEPVEVQLHLMGNADVRFITVKAEVSDEAKADVMRRFERHVMAAHDGDADLAEIERAQREEGCDY
jgi:hypothetical protein